jgi:hypothetical protein
MLRLFRTRAWCVVTALVLAAGTTTTALDGLLHTRAPHDAACVTTVEAPHDATSHRVAAVDAQGAHTGHCVACHLARTPRLNQHATSVAVLTDEAAGPRPTPSIGSIRASELARLPARSPPGLA